jgi:hypothetical protein
MPAAALRPRRRRSHHLGALLAATCLLVLAAGTELAHAHGTLEVPTAQLRAAGHELEVTWSAAEDDAAAIAVGLGLAPRQALLDHLAGLAALDDDGDPQPLVDELIAEVGTDQLAGSTELSAYLTAAVTVQQGETACVGTVGPTDRFLTDGATLTFRCPDPVDEVALTITILHEQDPTHRTFSTDGRGEVAIHSAATPTQVWTLTSDPGGAGAQLAALAVGLTLATVTGGGALLLLRRPAALPAPAPETSP